MVRSLDLAKLPEVRSKRIALSISDDLKERMRVLPRCLDRALNATRFAFWSSCGANVLICPQRELAGLRDGCFRAALAEFVSIEEVMRLDMDDAGGRDRQLRMDETDDPKLHLFRLLRHHEIHLAHSRLSATEKEFLVGEKSILLPVWSLEEISTQSLMRVRNAKRYTPSDIKAMVDWLDVNQRDWGIQHLFLLAVESYCENLVGYCTRDNNPRIAN
jgi:hypothetical protein